MILGLRTAIYPCPDLAIGKAFYSAVLGSPPYFDEPFYVGYQVGGFELGLQPDAQPSLNGSEAYWGCADISAEVARLLSLGARPLSPVTEVGGGIKVATVADPMGNAFHLIENPHFNPAAVR